MCGNLEKHHLMEGKMTDAPKHIRTDISQAAVPAALERVAATGNEIGAGVADIAAERVRQIDEEGWTPEHDDQHIRGELGAAAACYAVPRRFQDEAHRLYYPATWDESWWKPDPSPNLDGRRRELVKAGALIAAEIDRLDRATIREGDET